MVQNSRYILHNVYELRFSWAVKDIRVYHFHGFGVKIIVLTSNKVVARTLDQQENKTCVRKKNENWKVPKIPNKNGCA